MSVIHICCTMQVVLYTVSIFPGDESLSIQLRKHCTEELNNNLELYFNHPHLERVASQVGDSKDLLLLSIFGEDTVDFAQTHTIYEAFQYEAKSSSADKRWASILHVLALSTVLGTNIVSLYPCVPFKYRSLLNSVIQPLRASSSGHYAVQPQTPVVILWTRAGDFDQTPGAIFQPNHVVPVLPSHFQKALRRPTAASSQCTQSKISNFFCGKASSQTSGQARNGPSAHTVTSQQSDRGQLQRHEQANQELTKNTSMASNSENTNSIPSVGNLKANPSDDPLVFRRSFKGSWQVQFPWLRKNGDIYTCKVCTDAKMTNAFTTGKATTNPKKDDFVKHERIADHKRALKVPQLQKQFSRASRTMAQGAKSAIMAQLATILVQAKEGIPISKNSCLVKLQAYNGLPSLELLGNRYQHNDSILDMCKALHATVKKEIEAEREQGGYPFYAVSADEGTDIANRSIVIMYIHFMGAAGTVLTRFLSVKELQGTTSDDVYTVIKDTLAESSLDIKDMVGIATDGAGVMVGCRTGVVTRLKREIPHLISVHCMAHRLQLASEKAAHNVPYIVKYISVLNQLAKALKFSPKLCRLLETSKQLYGEDARKVHQIFFTRWLSFADSVQALCECICAVLSCLSAAAAERNVSGRAVLHGVMTQIATYKFVAMTHFLADSVGILALLSKAMQKRNVNYSEVKSHIEAAITAIQALQQNPGPHMQIFLETLSQPQPCPSGYATYKSHDIKDSESQRQKFHEAADAYTAEIVMSLQSRFPDSDIMENFSALCPNTTTPVSTEQVQFLLDKYSHTINQTEARLEWSLLQQVMRQPAYSSLDLAGFYEKFFHSHKDSYPNLSTIAAIGSLIPVTSVECERGISQYNHIKTASRNMITVQNMNTLLCLTLHAKPLETFNFDAAFGFWAEAKPRPDFTEILKHDSL